MHYLQCSWGLPRNELYILCIRPWFKVNYDGVIDSLPSKLKEVYKSYLNIIHDNRMILKDVEIAPVYNGCEGLSKEEIKKCFNNKVSTFIKREFNLSLSKDLNLSEPKQVEAFFVINENGNLTGMKVRNSELNIQAEIVRVFRKMPVMKPAIHNGKSVSVLCSIIVKYGNEIEINAVYVPEIPND